MLLCPPAGWMMGVGLPGLPQVHRGPGGGGDGAPATQELAGLLDALTRLLLTQTQSIEVENCRPAHGLGLVRRRGAAQAAAIASRYTAPPSLHGGGLADVHVAPLGLVHHPLEGRHVLGGHRHRAGVVVSCSSRSRTGGEDICRTSWCSRAAGRRRRSWRGAGRGEPGCPSGFTPRRSHASSSQSSLARPPLFIKGLPSASRTSSWARHWQGRGSSVSPRGRCQLLSGARFGLRL